MEEGQNEKDRRKLSFEEHIKRFERQVVNSSPYIEANNPQSDLNVKLLEINESCRLLKKALAENAAALSAAINPVFGQFRTYSNIKEMHFYFAGRRSTSNPQEMVLGSRPSPLGSILPIRSLHMDPWGI
jgi:hypothetical protein